MLLFQNKISRYKRPHLNRVFRVNKYKIRFNEFWNEWQVTSEKTGDGENFKTLKEAKEYAKKG